MFIFARCLRSSAAVTPAKYELDIIQVTTVFIIGKNWENNGTEKIVTPTPGSSQLPINIKSSCIGNRKLCINWVNIMNADALVPGVARSSAAMVMTIWNGNVLVIFESESKQSVVFQGWGIIQNHNTYSGLLKTATFMDTYIYHNRISTTTVIIKCHSYM